MAGNAKLTVEEILAQLAETPQSLAALTAPLSPAQLRTSPDPGNGEWSASDVLAHLRSCADVWGGNIQVILTQEEPTIRVISPRAWIDKTNYPGLAFRPSLRAFTKQRAGLLATLRSLPPRSWKCQATVTGAGKPMAYTVHYYAERLAVHERVHVKHVADIVSAVAGRLSTA